MITSGLNNIFDKKKKKSLLIKSHLCYVHFAFVVGSVLHKIAWDWLFVLLQTFNVVDCKCTCSTFIMEETSLLHSFIYIFLHIPLCLYSLVRI